MTLMIEHPENAMATRMNSSRSTKESTHLQIPACSEGPVLLLHPYGVELTPPFKWPLRERPVYGMAIGAKELGSGFVSPRASLGLSTYCFNSTCSLTQCMVF